MELKDAAAEGRLQRKALPGVSPEREGRRSCCPTAAGGGFPAGKAGRFPASCCHVLYLRILSNDKRTALIGVSFHN